MSKKSAGEYRTPGLALPCRRPEWGGALALVVTALEEILTLSWEPNPVTSCSQRVTWVLWPRPALGYLKVESQLLCHFFWPQTAAIPQLLCSSQGMVWDPSYILWVPR